MARPNYKTMYDAVVTNADRTADGLREENEWMKNQLRLANEKLAALELKVDIALGILGGKKGEDGKLS